jgi:hypothetical protein
VIALRRDRKISRKDAKAQREDRVLTADEHRFTQIKENKIHRGTKGAKKAFRFSSPTF